MNSFRSISILLTLSISTKSISIRTDFNKQHKTKKTKSIKQSNHYNNNHYQSQNPSIHPFIHSSMYPALHGRIHGLLHANLQLFILQQVQIAAQFFPIVAHFRHHQKVVSNHEQIQQRQQRHQRAANAILVQIRVILLRNLIK